MKMNSSPQLLQLFWIRHATTVSLSLLLRRCWRKAARATQFGQVFSSSRRVLPGSSFSCSHDDSIICLKLDKSLAAAGHGLCVICDPTASGVTADPLIHIFIGLRRTAQAFVFTSLAFAASRSTVPATCKSPCYCTCCCKIGVYFFFSSNPRLSWVFTKLIEQPWWHVNIQFFHYSWTLSHYLTVKDFIF